MYFNNDSQRVTQMFQNDSALGSRPCLSLEPATSLPFFGGREDFKVSHMVPLSPSVGCHEHCLCIRDKTTRPSGKPTTLGVVCGPGRRGRTGEGVVWMMKREAIPKFIKKGHGYTMLETWMRRGSYQSTCTIKKGWLLREIFQAGGGKRDFFTKWVFCVDFSFELFCVVFSDQAVRAEELLPSGARSCVRGEM